MAKSNGKNSTLIDDPQRCDICNTTLTLYPKDFAPCPHCQKRICRQCWAGAWAAKSFSADACSHVTISDTLRPSSVTQGTKGFNWDWPKIGLAGAMVILIVIIALFLFNLFA